MIQKSNDFESAKKKIAQYLMYKGISHYEFSKKTGLSNGFLNSGSGISSDALRLISIEFDDLNILWVITGEGEMIKENASPKCKPKMQAQSIENASPNASPIQENDSIELSPKSKPKIQAQSAENLSPNLSPNEKTDFTDNNNLHTQSDAQTARPNCTPNTMNMHAQSDAQYHQGSNYSDDILKVCQSCIEKDNTIVILKDFIKSKDETINAKNEAVIALNKALTAKDEALIAKDEVIRSKNELIEELLQKDDLDTEDMPVSSAS